jgi:AI-2 transport protein TqsA
METTARDPLPRGLLLLLGAAATVVVFAGMRAVSEIIGPAFLALVLTVLLHPVRGWLTSRHLPGWAASTVCILSVYALLIGLAAAVVVATGRFATLLPTYQDRFNELVDDFFSRLNDLGVGDRQIQSFVDSLDLSNVAGVVTGAINGLFGIISSLVFICMLVLFMTFDAGSFPRHLAAIGRERPAIATSFQTFASGTRTYLLVSTVFGFIVAVLDTIALAVLDVPVPLLWGLLAFITNYIPNIGFIIGLIPPAVLGLLEGGPGLMIAVIVVYCIINLILQSVIQPKFVGDAVGLSTSITFLSLVFWAFVLGALGALLAIPLTLLVKAILVDADPRNAWLEPLLSNRAAAVIPEESPAPAIAGPATAPTP